MLVSQAIAMEKPTCQICEMSFFSHHSLVRHKKAVHGCVRYQCPLCIKRLSRKEHLRNHIKHMHGVEREAKDAKDKELRQCYQYVCEICEKRLKTKQCLDRHVRGKHSTSYYQCKKCIRRFHWKFGLDNHTKKTHATNNLTYETKCYDGMEMFKLMVDECVPLDVMLKTDHENMKLYMSYVRNKASLYMDENVDYST